MPTTTQSLDELHGYVKALARKLRVAAFSAKGFAIGIDDFKVADDPGPIPFGGQIGGAPPIGDSALLGCGLLGYKMNAGQAVFHIAESNQDLLTVSRDAFFEGGLGTLIVGAIASAGENRQ